MEPGDIPTTEGILRVDVEDAMIVLGIHNPKPEIPLELTLSGHEIVALARRHLEVLDRLAALEEILQKTE